LRTEGTHFQALARAIVFQQLSGKAAGTIFARLNALYPTDGIAPNAVLATADEELRSVGMSRQKIAYLKDLSAKVLSGALPLDAVESMDDDDLIAHLVQVKGIGRWTAQMFLMFRLGRPDVLPELDLGIQNAIRRVYRMRKRPTPQQVKKIGARWSPHSSVACWYLWRSLENGDGQLGAD
jgi:3-methyladenine DNA glycosylase/8-oxoguanine DNA glycosylase